MKLLSLSPIIFLTACAAAPEREAPYIMKAVPVEEAGGFECDASAVAYAKGQKATSELAARLMREAGGESMRWIPPGSAVTMDYRQSRLNISYDDDYIITDIQCG